MGKRGPIGAVLAGGRAHRLGGGKALADLGGRPLICWPLEALRVALGEVVVVAKAATELPPLEVPVWLEPDEPSHPRAGVVFALERAGGRAVLACAADLPFVDTALVRVVAGTDARGAPAVVPLAAGRLQPLLARYEPEALGALRSAPPGEALTATVEGLDPYVLEWPDERPFRNVNTAQELRAAAQEVARGS
jgi:molybdopterin-guanine dinucleotide biosynthesis protein A